MYFTDKSSNFILTVPLPLPFKLSILKSREGMGLLEYRAMPSLHDLAHDSVLLKFGKRSAPDRGKL